MVFLRMGINKIVIGTTLGLLLLVALIYMVAEKEVEESGTALSSVKIEETWKLPTILSEISGLAYLDTDRMVGVQDEQGKLFVYNLSSKKIEKEVEFGSSGDYEGVALYGSTAFVLVSNGSIIKIEDFLSAPKVSKTQTRLTSKADTEGLCLDEKNNRLLVAVKEEDPNGEMYKGIYSVSLSTMEMQEAPVFNISMDDPVFKNINEKDVKDIFKPSEINLHPETGEIYLVGGANSRLLILGPQGDPKKFYVLDKADFPQPEGLTFDASGNLYISNEGSPGTIHRVSLN